MKKSLLLVLFSIQGILIYSQTAPNKYWIQFTDKNHNPYSLERPEEFLSQKAIQRRIKQNIQLDANDLPITPIYIDSLKNMGITLLAQSKWMNGVTIYTTDSSLLEELVTISFISNYKKTAFPKHITDTIKKKRGRTFPLPIDAIPLESPYGLAAKQIQIHNGDYLHARGFKGKGMVIAVIDAGFHNADQLHAFDSIWQQDRLLGTRDFVKGGNIEFASSSHGTSVLSIMAANLPGSYIGAAPEASYWLIRSEDHRTEYIIEEYNWLAAAEFADSAGADIINISLGYSEFDDPNQNHTYEEMDGNSTIVSKGADIAASRGMLIVCSAGNQGNKEWKYITAPADADSTLTVGAIDTSGTYALFSSVGPTPDGRVKPNIVSVGKGTYVLSSNGYFYQGNGTSYASPLIAGLAACLWQANPYATNMDILQAIERSSHHYRTPDSLLGYGIPDFELADTLLKRNVYYEDHDHPIIEPNPFTSYFKLNVPDSFYEFKIEIIDISGKKHIEKKVYPTAMNEIYITGLNHLNRGMYIVTINAPGFKKKIRIVKQ